MSPLLPIGPRDFFEMVMIILRKRPPPYVFFSYFLFDVEEVDNLQTMLILGASGMAWVILTHMWRHSRKKDPMGPSRPSPPPLYPPPLLSLLWFFFFFEMWLHPVAQAGEDSQSSFLWLCRDSSMSPSPQPLRQPSPFPVVSAQAVVWRHLTLSYSHSLWVQKISQFVLIWMLLRDCGDHVTCS